MAFAALWRALLVVAAATSIMVLLPAILAIQAAS
jgi:hypothetical protein